MNSFEYINILSISWRERWALNTIRYRKVRHLTRTFATRCTDVLFASACATKGRRLEEEQRLADKELQAAFAAAKNSGDAL